MTFNNNEAILWWATSQLNNYNQRLANFERSHTYVYVSNTINATHITCDSQPKIIKYEGD